TKILEQLIEKADASRRAPFLFDALDSTELNARTAHSFLARNATSYQVLCTRLDVKAQLRIHLAFHARAPQRCVPPRTERAPELHTSSGVITTCPAMTCALIRTSAPPWGLRAWRGGRECSKQRKRRESAGRR